MTSEKGVVPMPWQDGYTICDEQSFRDDQVTWPGQQQCAVGIIVDLRVQLDDPGSKDGSYRMQGHPRNIELKIENYLAQFSMDIGLERILDLFNRYSIQATFAVTEIIAEMYPEKIQSIMKQGHEVAAHGYRVAAFSDAEVEEEKELLETTTRVLREVCGQSPSGWFSLPAQMDQFAGGQVSPHTVDLLIDADYKYLGNGMADDIPHYWVTDFSTRRSILTLPYYFHLDDQFFLMFPAVGKGTGLENPVTLLHNWREEFDATYRRGRYFPMVVHPYLIGSAYHLDLLEKIISHMRGFPGVWFTTGSDVSQYWETRYPASSSLRF